jgi:hypothetical protein
MAMEREKRNSQSAEKRNSQSAKREKREKSLIFCFFKNEHCSLPKSKRQKQWDKE